jgi:hypothetical protein
MCEGAECPATRRPEQLEGELYQSLVMLSTAMFCLACSLGTRAAVSAAPVAETAGWLVYRNDRYFIELRYPPDYAIVQPRDQLRPPPLLRVWFKKASMVNSPIAEREPPALALDVYEKPLQEPLDAWLSGSGLLRNFTRLVKEPVELGGAEGVRVVEQTMAAPNTFYYVARGPYVYRFTPLGGPSDEMLATLRFTQ